MNPALIAALGTIAVAAISAVVTVYRVMVVDRRQVNHEELTAFRESEESFRKAERDYRAEIKELLDQLGASERERRIEVAAAESARAALERKEAECQRDREALQAEIDRLVRLHGGAP